MGAILHATRTGHRCKRPTGITIPAGYIKAGEMLGLGEWNLFYFDRQRAYIVHRNDKTGDYYQFNNFNCAVAKLAELGR